MLSTLRINHLITETKRLSKALGELTEKYDESNLDSDARILNRLLTNDWRLLLDVCGPLEYRYVEAASWMTEYKKYICGIRDYYVCFVAEPETALCALPLNGSIHQRFSALECLRRFALQQEILEQMRRIEKKEKVGRGDNEVQMLRVAIAARVKATSLKEVAAAAGCDRDTLADFLAGRTKVQERTLNNFRKVHLAQNTNL